MPARTDRAASLRHPDGSPVRVLVVDDEPNIAELLAMALRLEGWEIRRPHRHQAVTAARKQRPDAVVLDMMLPDFDGLEVLRRIRAHHTRHPGAVPDRARTPSRTASPG